MSASSSLLRCSRRVCSTARHEATVLQKTRVRPWRCFFFGASALKTSWTKTSSLFRPPTSMLRWSSVATARCRVLDSMRRIIGTNPHSPVRSDDANAARTGAVSVAVVMTNCARGVVSTADGAQPPAFGDLAFENCSRSIVAFRSFFKSSAHPCTSIVSTSSTMTCATFETWTSPASQSLMKRPGDATIISTTPETAFFCFPRPSDPPTMDRVDMRAPDFDSAFATERT
mmetsp:Transcript_20532/g.69606  ORF Transcript_20532/g.69606 Transcript_20532/m.69606 type:complete len:229 (+) Transcript_20532:654-1340(+)